MLHAFLGTNFAYKHSHDLYKTSLFPKALINFEVLKTLHFVCFPMYMQELYRLLYQLRTWAKKIIKKRAAFHKDLEELDRHCEVLAKIKKTA